MGKRIVFFGKSVYRVGNRVFFKEVEDFEKKGNGSAKMRGF